jgi:AFG3 family protein
LNTTSLIYNEFINIILIVYKKQVRYTLNMIFRTLLLAYMLYSLGNWYFYSPQLISEKIFSKEILQNTSKINMYGNNEIYIYTENLNSPEFYFDTHDKEKFIDKLDILNYEKEFYYSNGKPFSIFDYWPIFIYITIFFSFIRKSISEITGFSNFMEINLKVSTKLDDVAGLESNKLEILEFIDFFNNAEKYSQMGAKMPKGALFYGPPGTGKTLLAKAIAGQCGIPFISTSGSDFNQMYVGVGSSRVRSIFKKARRLSPCVVFIDEIDAMARKRDFSTSSGQSEKETTLNQLLVELDGFKENQNIIFIAATNRIDILDEALLRPGRFDRKIRFDLPEIKDREKIFNLYLNKMKLNENIKELVKYFSKISIGFSSADISNICNEACILSVRNGQEFVNKQNIENAIDNVILGPEKKTFMLNEKEKKIVAYHEAGHTVVSYIMKNANNPLRVSIVPRGIAALGFSQSENNENKLMTQNEIISQICVLLGGRVAEEIFFSNDITTGASDDIQKLTQLAYRYITNFGMGEEIPNFHFDNENLNYSDKTKEIIDEEVKKIIKNSHEKVTNIINKNKVLVKKIANELLEKETLQGKELYKILNKKNKKNLDNI